MFNELRLFFFYGPLKQTKQQYVHVIKISELEI